MATGQAALVGEMSKQDLPPILYLIGQDSHRSDVHVPAWWLQDHPRRRSYLMTFGHLESVERQMSDRTLEEVWDLEASVTESDVAQFLVEFISGRGIDLIEIAASRLALDLVPAARMAFPDLKFIVDLRTDTRLRWDDCSYATSRYGNLVDAYVTDTTLIVDRLGAQYIPATKIHSVPPFGSTEELGVFSDTLYCTLMGGASVEPCSDHVLSGSRT